MVLKKKMGRNSSLRAAIIPFALYFIVTGLFLVALPSPGPAETGSPSPAVRSADLDTCIRKAMENSRLRSVSRYALFVAEAQHRQALAGYWPQVSGRIAWQHMDQPINFLFPAQNYEISAQQIPLPDGFSIPLTGPDGTTTALTSIEVPAQAFEITEQDVKLLDEDLVTASLNLQWLLYDGGMRKGYREQSGAQVELMTSASRRTDLEIIDTVKRMYYGAVLAGQILNLGQITLERMEATLLLTETLYTEGGGTVKKTDWLDNKIMVESIRSMVAELEKNQQMSQAALASAMGLSWENSVCPADSVIPYQPFSGNLETLVSGAYAFNPDWHSLEAGLRAVKGMKRTAKSGYFPKLGLFGKLSKWWNGYNAGLDTPENENRWNIGIGIEVPLFDGFLTSGKIDEAEAMINKLKNQKILLKEGLGLQLKQIFLSLKAAEKSFDATLSAMEAAIDSRDLNTRAYQMELVETEKVIRAQFTEAVMSAQHFKACYDHAVLQSRLQRVVGTEIKRLFQEQ